jgi:predicted DNA-binding transcriptional regulator AlpA
LELRPLLGVEEVSQLLGIPKATLYRWHSMSTSNAPQGPRAFRMGRYLRYTLEDVRSYIEELRMNSA